MKVLSARWRRRLLFVLGGIAVGGAAVALAALADWAQRGFAMLLGYSHYIALGVTPAGFVLAVLLTRQYFPSAQGSGIPQAIAARQLTDQGARARLVSIRVAIGKVLLTLLGLLCGASAGREGPTVQIGASIMFAAGRLSPRRQPGLVLAGAAAGVAAAFNTPLAGIVFGIEELSRSFETRASGLILSAVIAAGLTTLALVGNYTYFGSTPMMLQNGADWLAVPICGVIGGLCGGLFSRFVIAAARGLPSLAGTFLKKRPLVLAGLCGLGVALCGLTSGDLVYGTGYEQVKTALENGTPLPESFGLLKFAATALTAISGIPGGIFAPSLAVGAGIGSNVAQFFHGAPVGPIVILGMVAYFAGVVQAPLTAVVIVMEMTSDKNMVIPLMATALFAASLSRLIGSEPLYHALARGYYASAFRIHGTPDVSSAPKSVR